MLRAFYLPLRHGGLGLMSSAAAAPALAASWQLALPRLLVELDLADATALQMHVPRVGPSLQLVQRFLQKQRQSALPAPSTGPNTPIITQQALMRAQATRDLESWQKSVKLNPMEKA